MCCKKNMFLKITNSMKKIIHCRILLVLLLGIAFVTAHTQTIVRGIIKDANTQQPLQSVSIYFKGGKGVTSASDGSYTLATENSRITTIQFSYVGYKTITKTIAPNKEQVMNIELEVADAKSNVVVKTNKRGRYSNKDNPA